MQSLQVSFALLNEPAPTVNQSLMILEASIISFENGVITSIAPWIIRTLGLDKRQVKSASNYT